MNSVFLSLPTFQLLKNQNETKITLFIHMDREAFTSTSFTSEPKIYVLTHLAVEIKSFLQVGIALMKDQHHNFLYSPSSHFPK